MSQSASRRGLAYEVKSRAVPGGAFRPHAIVSCAGGCGGEGVLRMPDNSNNPERVQENFRRLGWTFDAWNARRCLCRGCTEQHAGRRAGDSPKESGKQPIKGDQAVTANILKISASTMRATPPSRTSLTVEDKRRLRDHLAGVFDEDKGFYLDSSDAKVSADLDLPEALVRKYREDAFGPLKSVPEIDALKAEIDNLQERSRNNVREAGEIVQAVAMLKAKAEATLQRLGVRA